MTASRTAAIRLAVGGLVPPRVGAMAGRGGVLVVIGEPEQPAVVRRLVLGRVIDVDVGDVSGQRGGDLPPPPIPGADELQDRTVDRIVLIVVMGDDRRRATVVGGLVVGVD